MGERKRVDLKTVRAALCRGKSGRLRVYFQKHRRLVIGAGRSRRASGRRSNEEGLRWRSDLDFRTVDFISKSVIWGMPRDEMDWRHTWDTHPHIYSQRAWTILTRSLGAYVLRGIVEWMGDHGWGIRRWNEANPNKRTSMAHGRDFM